MLYKSRIDLRGMGGINLTMSDVSSASSLSRRCIGPCRRELPLTREYFYFRERARQFEGCCRACQIEKTLAKRKTRRTQDGLQGGVMETRRKVKAAFVEMDPGGIRERELYRRLEVIVKNFRKRSSVLSDKCCT